MITFAVIGHNEAETLDRALQQAEAATNPEDVVWFVDSASEDSSALVAGREHITRLAAPLGKGRAMQFAVQQCQTEYICFVDADMVGSAHNIPLLLAEAVRASRSDMIVGDFNEGDGLLSNTQGIYEPLVAKLFPEAAGRYGSKPLSGFRIFKAASYLGYMPDDFGVEAHLNVVFAMAEATMEVCRLGDYTGRFLYKPHMGTEIAAALLDLAVSRGRLASSRRSAYEQWVEAVVEHIATYQGEQSGRSAYEVELKQLAARPLPDTF